MNQPQRSPERDETALQVVAANPGSASAPKRYDPDEVMRQVITAGNLEQLSGQQLASYYLATCESLGLNPLTRPFDLIKLDGKLTMYARKDATDQIRALRGVSVTKIEQRIEEGMFVVTVTVQDRTGRTDQDIGAVPLANLSGVARANAMMKAITKAKRRATLAICGLGMLDETETETIPGAQRVEFDPLAEHPQLVEAAAGESPGGAGATRGSQPRHEREDESDQARAMRRLHAVGRRIGMDHDLIKAFAAAKSGKRVARIRSLNEWPANSLSNLADLIEREGAAWLGELDRGVTFNGDAIETTGEVVDTETGEISGPATADEYRYGDLDAEIAAATPMSLPLEDLPPVVDHRNADRWTR